MKDGFIPVAAATPKVRVADCRFNAQETWKLLVQAAEKGVKLAVFPELGLTGYTCGDLFFQPSLLDAAWEALLELCEKSRQLDIVWVCGLPVSYGGKLYNCAAVVCHGKVLGFVPKTCLPNYGEFYEQRWFMPAPEEPFFIEMDSGPVLFGAKQLFCCEGLPEFCFAVEICEDLWTVYPPSMEHARAGAALIANLSASNEVVGKAEYRQALVTGQSGRLVCGYVYADAGEGESTTDLVFAGHNMIAENGLLLAQSRFSDGLLVSEIDVKKLCGERRRMTTWPPVQDAGYQRRSFQLPLTETTLTRPVARYPFLPPDGEGTHCEEILRYQAIGLRKRMEHSGAKTLVIGVSGGLDSTLALIAAARTLDWMQRPRSELIAVTMPCFGTTSRTKGNAEILCEQLGTTLREIDIRAAVEQHFRDIGHDPQVRNAAYENAQARERTQVLMDIANDTGGLVVGTGDLSELALGWATYNGDHMSMYGLNASIPKTLVRQLVRYAAETTTDEALKRVLLDILDTPVSPELLPAENEQIQQKTEDLVGPYELHDFYLYHIIRWAFPPHKVYRLAKVAFAGVYDDRTLRKWLRNFYRRFFAQQFKRSCVPDGPKVGAVALSPRGDWRMPSDASAALWLKEVEDLGEI